MRIAPCGHRIDRGLLRASAVACLGATLALLAGCESDGPSPADDIRARQDAALKDPFNFGPDSRGMPQTGADRPNISGGGLFEYDDAGMKRDLDRVLNP